MWIVPIVRIIVIRTAVSEDRLLLSFADNLLQVFAQRRSSSVRSSVADTQSKCHDRNRSSLMGRGANKPLVTPTAE